MNNGRDCSHGRQIGKCDTCDLIEAEKEIDTLKAQLKKSQHTNYALMTMINRYATEIARCQRKEGWHDNHPLVEVNTMTPTQCLAEHDIEVAAMAVEKAAFECKVAVVEGGAKWLCRVDSLEKYANKIKSGEIEP